MSRFVKIAGLCLASMLLVGMALAGTANATPLWLLCLEGSNLHTKYSSNQCNKVEEGGKWQSQGLAAGQEDTVRLLILTLKLRDTKVPILGESEVQCYNSAAAEGEGVIEGPNKGKITVARIKEPKVNCKGIKVCKEKEVEEVEGENLPWNTEITEEGGKFVSKIKASTSGKEPGWKVKCNTSVGSQTDECLSEAGKEESVTLENKESSGVLLILGTFNKTGVTKCSIGGAGAGKVEGQFALLLKSGNGLSITGI
jgi:hypothetical protein